MQLLVIEISYFGSHKSSNLALGVYSVQIHLFEQAGRVSFACFLPSPKNSGDEGPSRSRGRSHAPSAETGS